MVKRYMFIKLRAMMYEDGFAEVKHKAFTFGICP